MSASPSIEPASAPAPSRRPWLPLALLAFAGLLAIALFTYARVRLREAHRLPSIAQVPEFDARDQHARPFHAADMRGSVWVVDFIFTTCPTVCPRLTARMVDLQGRIEKHGKLAFPVKLLSITVDPENDTPDVLAAYAKKYGAHDALWTFATGKTDDLDRIVVQGFKQQYQKADPSLGIMEVMHGDRFVLVDPRGEIRAYYDTRDADALDRILADVERVADE